MTTARSRDTPPANTGTTGARVVVTGAATGLGRLLAQRLLDAPDVASVVALDLASSGLPGAVEVIADVREAEALAPALDGADVVVHLAVVTDPDADAEARRRLNRDGTAAILEAAADAQVPHVVVVTSAAVHGARADNPVPLDDDAPLLAEADGLVGDLLEMEGLVTAARAARPASRHTVVRPAALVGAGVDSAVTRHFASPRLLVVKGGAMRWQFAHADDVAAALELVVRGAVDGDELGVGCEGWLSTEEVARRSGLSTVEVPASLAFGTAERLHRAGLVPTPPGDLAYLVHPWLVSSSRLRAAGWRPAHDNAAALAVLLADVEGSTAVAGRVIRSRDATIAGAGVAGATVAVLGAAAFVRRARRLRGR